MQFSQKNYVVDESAGYVVLKVTVSGYRDIPISVNVKIFVSSKFQPAAGKYHINYVNCVLSEWLACQFFNYLICINSCSKH